MLVKTTRGLFFGFLSAQTFLGPLTKSSSAVEASRWHQKDWDVGLKNCLYFKSPVL